MENLRVTVNQRWKQIIQLKVYCGLNWLKRYEGFPTIPLRFMARSFEAECEIQKLRNTE
jgi:hypothetical protein